jgi:GNAT superfamily N-acetyltransferase
MSVRARPATAADYEQFLRLLPELGVDDPAPPPDRWASTMAPHTLLFEEQGQVVAYALTQALNEVGYVKHVVVDPAHRGRGFGRTVMETLAARFRDAGCSQWCLNVKPDNLPALHLYRSVGLEQAYASTALRIDWSLVERLPQPERNVTARVVEPGEERALEAAFGMPGGTLAAARTQGKVVLRLVDSAAPEAARVGLASFDPHYPGAFPFRAAHPSFARALLESMKLRALPEHSYVQMVVEDDAELSRSLVERGATVRMEILHLRAALAPA